MDKKKALEKKLNVKQKLFCKYYVLDWNASKAARKAGYSEKSAAVVAYEILRKPYIQEYIELIKSDYEVLCGVTKARQLSELVKIAYSTISDLHENWITLTEFEQLTDDQKAAIESIDTKTETRQEMNLISGEMDKINVIYVKIKLHSKTTALEMINKMMGYNEAEKSEVKGTIIQFQNVSKQFPNKK